MEKKKTLLDYQEEINSSAIAMRKEAEQDIWRKQQEKINGFILNLSRYHDVAYELFKNMVIGFSDEEDVLYPESEQSKNNLRYILIKTSMSEIGTVATKRHIGSIQVSLQFLSKHEIVSESFTEWNENSDDGNKVKDLIKTFNQYLEHFDLKIDIGVAIGKTPGISFCFQRIDKK